MLGVPWQFAKQRRHEEQARHGHGHTHRCGHSRLMAYKKAAVRADCDRARALRDGGRLQCRLARGTGRHESRGPTKRLHRFHDHWEPVVLTLVSEPTFGSGGRVFGNSFRSRPRIPRDRTIWEAMNAVEQSGRDAEENDSRNPEPNSPSIQRDIGAIRRSGRITRSFLAEAFSQSSPASARYRCSDNINSSDFVHAPRMVAMLDIRWARPSYGPNRATSVRTESKRIPGRRFS